MHSFLIETKGFVGMTAKLPDDEAKHAVKVLRLEAGSEVCVMDGLGGRFLARLEGAGGEVTLVEELPDNEPPIRVTLYQGFPKADKLDFIVQKLTELGAAAIVPVKSERAVVKLDEKDGRKRKERLERIAREATKQCRRAFAPEISQPLTWKQCAPLMQKHDLLLVPWEDAHTVTLKKMFADRPEAKDIGIIIGPEGGMSEEEVSALEALGAVPVTLGPRILRAETAAVSSVTAVMTLWGDLA